MTPTRDERTAMSVKRYDCDHDKYGFLGMLEHPQGDYVLASDYDALAAQLKQQIADEAEQDTAIRNLARPILGDAAVDGDGYGVPGLVDVVKALIGEKVV